MKNIIMILTDQHRIDTLSCFNPSTIVKTPNLDQLCEDGVGFSNCYTACPVCTPARSSLQLGLFPSKTGFETNSFEIGSRSHMLPDVEFSLPRRLQKAGYKTAYTGKWHLGLEKDKTKTREGNWLLDDYKINRNLAIHDYLNVSSVPSDHGYIGDDFEGHGVGGWKCPKYLDYLKDNGLELEISNLKTGTRQSDHTTTGVVTSGLNTTVEHFLVKRAEEIISDLNDDKFYLQLNFWGPHEPFFPPVEFYQKYQDVKIKKWDSFENTDFLVNDVLRRYDKDWNFFEESLRHYYAYIEYIDYEIGNLINYLKENNLYDDTVIIFSSDHGDYQGTHGHMENKSYGLYDDTTKVGLIIKDGKHKGCNEKLVGTCDIYETILDYAGVDLAEFNSDGSSLLKLLEGGSWDNQVICESTGAFPLVVTQRMFRIDNLKYIFTFGSKEQIYDMQKDPLELRNLADNEELLHKMRCLCLEKLISNLDPIRHMFAKIHKIGDYSV